MKIFLFSAEFFKRILTAVALLTCFGGAYFHSQALFIFLMFALYFLIFVFELPRLIKTNSLFYFSASVVYPGLSILSLIALNNLYHSENIWIPMYPFFAPWAADTFAYLVGKSIGRHKMTPIISPGKTWEGFIGGFLGVCLFNFWFLPKVNIDLFNSPYWAVNCLSYILFAALITVVAFFGGLFVSFLKRSQDLKDAGILLPGHGGLLDRFDSVFFVGPVWLLVCFLFK